MTNAITAMATIAIMTHFSTVILGLVGSSDITTQ
jgi:hypothetical protein